MRHGAQASAYWIKRVVADLGWDTMRSALSFYNKVSTGFQTWNKTINNHIIKTKHYEKIFT